MELDIFSYQDLLNNVNPDVFNKMQAALLQKGIIGIRGVPEFENKSHAFVGAAQQFAQLSDPIKQQYKLDRDKDELEGYEFGAEQFKNPNGVWQVDDKKASYYACVIGPSTNRWPAEMDLKTPYLELGKLIYNTGKLVMNVIGLNAEVGLHHEEIATFGRMLHYQKDSDATNDNPYWCGAHFDHGVFTGLMPAYYFRYGQEMDEPAEAGLFIKPTNGEDFVKIDAADKSILMFQIGEFGQLASNDHIKATQHRVNKANSEVERFTFALFFDMQDHTVIRSTSLLTQDSRYTDNQQPDGNITYGKWSAASYARYRAL